MMLIAVTFIYFIFVNNCQPSGSSSHSQFFTLYVKDKFLSGFKYEYVVKDRISCVNACSLDDVCFGVAYHKIRQKCYFYNTFPSCHSSPDVGLVTYLPLGTFMKHVALNKPTAMSSIYMNEAPCQAVNGILTRHIHTYGSELEWWCVDLEKKYNFKSIVIYNRNSGGTFTIDRLREFELRLSDTGSCTLETFNDGVQCYKDIEPTAQTVYNITSCNQPKVSFSSKFIFISPRPNSILNFRELVVLI